MGNLLTYIKIKNYIENEESGNGCILITNEKEFELEKTNQSQNNSKVKLKIKCKCGNPYDCSFDNFKRRNKKQCNNCVGLNRNTIDEVKHFVEIESKSGCKLLSDTFINATTKMRFLCKCGEEFETTFNKFKSSNKTVCNKCGFNNRCDKNRTPYIDVKNYIENESNSGCKLLTLENEYINTNSKINIRCKCGENFTTTFKQFISKQSQKQYCDDCGENSRRNNLKTPFLDLTLQIEKFGCKLLSKENEYTNSNSKLKFQCSCGNTFTTSISVFMRDTGYKRKCNLCVQNDKPSYKIPYEDIVKLFKDNNCELLINKERYYKIKDNKVEYMCSCGNKAIINTYKFRNGSRCRKCLLDRVKTTNLKNNGVEFPSQNKEILAKQRQSLYQNGTAPCSKQQKHIHTIIGGELNYPVKTLSLDIAFPEEMIYFEYDGGLHDGNVKFGTLTQTEFNEKEKSRNYALLRSGWKEIRLISRKDYIPKNEKLLEIIEIAKYYLNSGRHYIKFDVDNSTIINSRGKFDYDFGSLITI